VELLVHFGPLVHVGGVEGIVDAAVLVDEVPVDHVAVPDDEVVVVLQRGDGVLGIQLEAAVS
jgi:hypothetical protein